MTCRFVGIAAVSVALAVFLAGKNLAAMAQSDVCPFTDTWRPSQAQLNRILEAHKHWLESDARYRSGSEKNGKAYLCKADLKEFDLADKDLRGANLSGSNLRSVSLSRSKLQGSDLSSSDLRGAKLENAKLTNAILVKADLSDAILIEADLSGALLTEIKLARANLENAKLSSATIERGDLRRARLRNTNLRGATLVGAMLQGADLREANLSESNLQSAHLQQADLRAADLTNSVLSDADLTESQVESARFALADFTNAIYAPVSGAPLGAHLYGIKSLASVSYPKDMQTGIAQLRSLFKEFGLRELEREATFALEKWRTRYLLNSWNENRWSNLGSGLEGAFRYVLFEWTTEYGWQHGRALKFFGILLLVCTAIYAIPTIGILEGSAGTIGIRRIWPNGETELLNWGTQGWTSSYYPFYFSLLSAFRIGFRDLNFGTIFTLVQLRDYRLEGLGWVRVVSGLQSLFSVYLIAIWVLTYFGRPFD